jgi:hypothetical protein
MAIGREHPTQSLLFYLSSDFDDQMVEKMENCVAELAVSRNWVIRPPEFINIEDKMEHVNSQDEPIRTVGGMLEIYSNLPPWDKKIPKDVDQAHFEEVQAIIEALVKFSKELECEITFELDEEEIGSIQEGIMDSSLSEGLLSEWKRSLRQSDI